MDLPWDDPRTKKFVTNVGLITSDGPNGPDVMACEWTHHVSYSPGLIAICIRPTDATAQNIHTTKEFGVCLCASDQPDLSSISGNYSGHGHDKVAALKELGVKFTKSKKIKPPMIEGAALYIECKLFKELSLGDHTMFVGEIVEAIDVAKKKPMVLHGGSYWELTKSLPKPSDAVRNKIEATLERHKK